MKTKEVKSLFRQIKMTSKQTSMERHKKRYAFFEHLKGCEHCRSAFEEHLKGHVARREIELGALHSLSAASGTVGFLQNLLSGEPVEECTTPGTDKPKVH